MWRNRLTITGSETNASRPSAISMVGRSGGIWSVQRVVGQRRGHRMRVVVGGHELLAQRDDVGQIDAVPVDRGRRRNPLHGGAQARAEVDDDGVGMFCDELAGPVVEHLRAQRRLAYRARRHSQTVEVVVDLGDDLGGQGVAEYRPGPTAVDRSGVLGDKRGLLDRRQVGDRNSHTGNVLRD